MAEDKDKDHAKDKEHAGAKPAPAKPKKIIAPDDEGDGKPAAAGAPSQKTLATALSRAIVIATVIGSLSYAATSLFAQRFEIIASPYANASLVYKLDRLTGQVTLCGQQQCTPLGK